jgi:hypothetical protein
MRTPTRLLVLLLGLALAGCGEESDVERLAGTYATDAVQADLEEHEKDFVSDGLFAKFDDFDRAGAEEEGTVWARLRLATDGRFEYEGPAEDGGSPKARVRGRWTPKKGLVELVVASAKGEGADGLPKTMACPLAGSAIELPFLTDPRTRRPLRLARR